MRATLVIWAVLPAAVLGVLAVGWVPSPMLAFATGLCAVAFAQAVAIASTPQRALALGLGLLTGLLFARAALVGAVPTLLTDVTTAQGQLRSVVGLMDGARLETLSRDVRVVLPGSSALLATWAALALGAAGVSKRRPALALGALVVAAGIAGVVGVSGLTGQIGLLEGVDLQQLAQQQQPVGAGRTSSVLLSASEGPFRMADAAGWMLVAVAMGLVALRGALALRGPAGGEAHDARAATLFLSVVLACAGLLGLSVAMASADVSWFATAPLARVHALALVGTGLVLTGVLRRDAAVQGWLVVVGGVLGYVAASLEVLR